VTPSISVVVATVAGRERSLDRCLGGLQAQTRPADQIVVVRGQPSTVAALRQGWQEASGDWVAFVDDDAIPQTDWLERLSEHLDDPVLGAVGGRILNVDGGRTTAHNYEQGRAATLSWFGRTRSRLHDIPATRRIEAAAFLPGSNLCVRRAALAGIDPALDCGMAPGLELALCLELRRAGWSVRFDSDALVTHYPAPRPGGLERADRARYSYEYSRTLVYALLRHLPWPRKVAFAVYFALVGQRASPGLVASPYFLLPGRDRRRLLSAWRGKLHGALAAVRRSPGVTDAA
jgi:cellulose synthase/poly-beta-1,6-N-acetylglucosamine synthase-like glycosyltransferase